MSVAVRRARRLGHPTAFERADIVAETSSELLVVDVSSFRAWWLKIASEKLRI